MTPEVRAQLEIRLAKALTGSTVKDREIVSVYDDLPHDQRAFWAEAAAEGLRAILSATDEHGERLVVGRDELEAKEA